MERNGGTEKGTMKQIEAGWNGWGEMAGVLYDRKIPARLKGKMYKTTVRLTMIYG